MTTLDEAARRLIETARNKCVLAEAREIFAAAIGTARTSSHRLHSNAIAQSSGFLARDGHYNLEAAGMRCNYL